MRLSVGWFRIDRKCLESDIGRSETTLSLWVHLLGMASIGPVTVRCQGRPEKFGPGTIVTSVAELARRTGLSGSTIRRQTEYLLMRGSIGVKATNKGTIITICNWSQYQSSGASNEKTGEQTAEQTSEQLNKNKEGTRNKLGGSSANVVVRTQDATRLQEAFYSEDLPRIKTTLRAVFEAFGRSDLPVSIEPLLPKFQVLYGNFQRFSEELGSLASSAEKMKEPAKYLEVSLLNALRNFESRATMAVSS